MATNINTAKLVDQAFLKAYDLKVYDREDAKIADAVKDIKDNEVRYKLAEATTTEGALKTYELLVKTGEGDFAADPASVKIDIPRDFVVKNASLLLKVTEEQAATILSEDKQTVTVGHSYIVLTINTVEGAEEQTKIYLDVESLIDIYDADEVGITVNDAGKLALKAIANTDADDVIRGISGADFKALEDAVDAISVTKADQSDDTITGVNATVKSATYTIAATTVDDAAVATTGDTVTNKWIEYGEASQSAAGLLSAVDKVTIDTIAGTTWADSDLDDVFKAYVSASDDDSETT